MTSYKNKEGRQVICPYYTKWKSMLVRCYSKKYQERQPTYIGCTVSKDWLLFSNFRCWMEKQDWEGKQLDKDILVPDNVEYNEAACIFVSHDINTLLTDRRAVRGKYAQGVSWHKRDNKYTATCNIKGKSQFLGYFNTEGKAEIAYCNLKADLITKTSNEPEAVSQPRLHQGLILHAQRFTNRADYLTNKEVD